jgi:hypothetical protein
VESVGADGSMPAASNEMADRPSVGADFCNKICHNRTFHFAHAQGSVVALPEVMPPVQTDGATSPVFPTGSMPEHVEGLILDKQFRRFRPDADFHNGSEFRRANTG